MKLNKTLMIAALVAGSVFAADVAVRAQDATNTPPAGARPPGARSRPNFDNMAAQLALTDDQKTKAKPVIEEMQKKQAEVRNDSSLTDPTERRAKNKEIRDAATAKLKDILTPEQLAKWEKMGQGQRRPAGGAGAPPPAGGNKPPQ
jgi:Spy/CpxP family protein refolding chaperone